MRLVEGILQESHRQGGHVALLWDGVGYTYEEMACRVHVLSQEFQKWGLQGSVLGIRLSDPVQQLFYFLAAEKAGAVPLLLHEYLKGEEIFSLLQERPIDGVISDIPWGGIPWITAGKVYFYEKKKGQGRKGFAVLTSGSSGLPKVFFRTDESWSDFFPLQNKIFHIQQESRLYLQGSMAFTGNLNMAMAFLWEGATLVGTGKVRPRQWMADIEKEQVTHIYMIPSKLSVLSRVSGGSAQVSHILTGSQLMTEKVLSALLERFPKSRTILYYGASEMSYVTYIEGEDIRKHPDSVGKPFPGIFLSIKEGEIYVHTPYGIQGASQPMTCHDLGRLDEKGNLHFLGRREDVYHVKGNHVSRQKVLSHFLMLPGIEEAELLGVKESHGDDRICAFLVGDKEMEDKVLVHALKEKLQPWEIPARFIWLSHLPRTSTGKTDKRALEKLVEHIL